MSGPWHAVDGGGRDLATGRAPAPPGWPSPAAALAAAPVAAWPLAAVGEHGESVGLAAVLGSGGHRVEGLLDALTGRSVAPAADVEGLVRRTPAGTISLPLAVVGVRAAVEASAAVDEAWLVEVDRRRASMRQALVAAGRDREMEAALHVAMLVGTESLDPSDDTDVDQHVASGARLWMLTAAVVSALAGADPDPFDAWARLVVAGWWPVGPSERRLVVCGPG